MEASEVHSPSIKKLVCRKNNGFLFKKSSAVRWLCEKKKIAAIPNTAFYGADHKRDFENYIRFCFAKSDETIDNFERMMREGFQN